MGMRGADRGRLVYFVLNYTWWVWTGAHRTA